MTIDKFKQEVSKLYDTAFDIYGDKEIYDMKIATLQSIDETEQYIILGSYEIILDYIKALLNFDNESYEENIQAAYLKMSEKMNHLTYEN